MFNMTATGSPEQITVANVWRWLEEVLDPEIPVLNVVELGVVRQVEIKAGEHILVTITPTYSGCPAMHTIEDEIEKTIRKNFTGNYSIKTVLSPAWSSDWLTDVARMKLLEFGIAPPQQGSADKNLLMGKIRSVQCPRCKSTDTVLISQFGSTACKALYKCNKCLEPFDYFKCI